MEALKAFIVKDNGLRCFVPPCFSWDLVEMDSENRMTVSDVEFRGNEFESTDQAKLLHELCEGRLAAKGYVEEYTLSVPEIAKGIRLVIVDVEETSRPPY